MKGSASARVVIAAPAKAEDRLGKDSERTICGGIDSRVSNHNYPVLSFRTLESNIEVEYIMMSGEKLE